MDRLGVDKLDLDHRGSRYLVLRLAIGAMGRTA
jgi:hypothetical protein